MKGLLSITDNIEELLTKIIEFTKTRQKILMENITNIDEPGFVPSDLPVDEFADAIDIAVNEHVRSERLLFCDSENVKFGAEGNFATSAVEDEATKELFENDIDKYLSQQAKKLAENRLNNIVAVDMLEQKRGWTSILSEERL